MKKNLIKILLLLLIIVTIFVVIFLKQDKKKDKEQIKEENIIEVIKGKTDIDKDFLNWINENYKDSLNKLNKLLLTNNYSEDMWHQVTGNSYIVLKDLYENKYNNMDNVKIIESNHPSKISFVGDVSLADNWWIMPAYDERGMGVNGVFSDSVLDIFTKSDLMIVNSEFTVSDRGTPLPGKAYTFRASPKRLSIYYDMGIDLVTLANNHVYDYGKYAFLDMLDAFDEYKIPRIGAGKNLDEAKKAYYFIVNGYKIAFVNASRAEKNVMTPEATEDSEGIFWCYDPTNMINEIKELKTQSDFVIAIIHYGREGSHELEDAQVESSRQYIAAGADAVVGHHAHVLQGVEIYKEKPIIYNLGNFLFNPETLDTAIFQMVLNNDGTFEYYMIPALQKDEYTDTLDGEEKQRVIDDLNSWSINSYINSDGKIEGK